MIGCFQICCGLDGDDNNGGSSSSSKKKNNGNAFDDFGYNDEYYHYDDGNEEEGGDGMAKNSNTNKNNGNRFMLGNKFFRSQLALWKKSSSIQDENINDSGGGGGFGFGGGGGRSSGNNGSSVSSSNNGGKTTTTGGGGDTSVTATVQKASLALRLKRQHNNSSMNNHNKDDTSTTNNNRGSIFSSPINVSEAKTYQCQIHPKTDIERTFILTSLRDHILFDELSETELNELILSMERLALQPGTVLVHENDTGEDLYLVQHGSLSYRDTHVVGTLTPGDLYGEINLLYGQRIPHTVTATAATTSKKKTTTPFSFTSFSSTSTSSSSSSSQVGVDTVVWKLTQTTFRNVIAKHSLQVDSNIKSTLRRVPLFSTLPEQTLTKFANALTRVHFTAGERIVNKGDMDGDVFYIIEVGSVRVHDIGIGDSQTADVTLTNGDSFGERALLTGEPRAANVTAITDTTTLVMSRTTFQEHIGQLQELLDFPAKLQAIKGLPIFTNTDITDVELEQIAQRTVELCYKKGSKLFVAGKPYPSCCWMVRSGQVIVYGSKSTNIYNFQTGDYFGDKSILNPNEHISSHEATCETNVDAWVIERDDIESIIVNLDRLGNTAGYLKQRDSTVGTNSHLGLDVLHKHRILGEGGFGKVWLVQTKVSRKVYAMKIVNKRKLLESKQERSVLREKEMLSLLHHPFILYLVSSFQDEMNLYLVLPLIQGGELFSVVSNKRNGLPTYDAAFYGAGIIEALGHFHHRYIAYRDLKLENVMIDEDGYIRIVDLGFSKVILDKSYTFCGTPDYVAPEIIMARGHSYPVDYWSYGVLMFEILSGRSPFSLPNQPQLKMFKRIVMMDYNFPAKMNTTAKDMIDKLLQRNVTVRLGAGKNGYLDIRNHPFFTETAKIDHRKLIKKEIQAPWKPKVNDILDSQNFDDFSRAEHERPYGKRLTGEEQALFANF